ncbi:peptide transporter [Acetobacteraceae bacterium ESL0709]|nr:peptide transporter [Acetobacteraceae bacterium ESL0697]MDF7678215.1 peptide transporter [Acetobacteraceae bacterium ESL0709]
MTSTLSFSTPDLKGHFSYPAKAQNSLITPPKPEYSSYIFVKQAGLQEGSGAVTLMGPFLDHKTALELQSLSFLRPGQTEACFSSIENLEQADLRAFWEASFFFLQGDYIRAAYCIHAAIENGLRNPLTTLQKQLQTNEEEEQFLKLLDQFGELYGPSDALIELKGLSLIQLHRLYEAETLLRRRLHKGGRSHNLKTVLVKILCEQGVFGEALALLTDLLTQLPRNWEIMNNLAYLYNNTGEVERALTIYRHAIIIAPAEALLRLNHSIALLKIGRFSQGWQEHEWRLKLPFHTPLPIRKLLPTLNPGDSLQGKTVLITHEEGLGDAIMYSRYIPILAETGAFIHVWGSEQLSPLMEKLKGVGVSQVGGTCPDYDYHCPFISLPRALTPYPSMPFAVSQPYLSPSLEKRTQWQKRLSTIPPHLLRVGLVWSGGVHKDDRNSRLIDYHRSMDLKEMEPLFGDPLIQYISLQKGPKAKQLAPYSHYILDYMDECETMEDTAALMDALDIVITVDTSMVHLAGSIGKETVLMDRFCNCWRWGINQSETRWYPSVRIYRQPSFDDWQPVIRRLCKELTERALNKALS